MGCQWVTNMRWLFGKTWTFNQDITHWDVSQVLDLRSLFAYAQAFEYDLSHWVLHEDAKFQHAFYRSHIMRQYFQSDPIYGKIQKGNFDSYFQAFVEDAARYGLELPDTIDNYWFRVLTKEEIKEVIGDALDWIPNAFIYRRCGKQPVIVFEKTHWETQEVHEIMKTMWHELGHAVLKYNHLTQYGQIMSGRHVQDDQLPEGETDPDKDWTIWWFPSHWEQQMEHFFSGKYQSKRDCATYGQASVFICDHTHH